MRTLFAVLLIFLTTSVYADVFKLQTKSVLQGNINFSHLKVIDQRYEKERVGVLAKGLTNQQADLTTEKPFAEELESFAGSISQAAKKGSDTLILVLYDFYIQDRPNNDEIGVFHFDGDFFSGGANNYLYLGGIDSLYEIRSSWDVTDKIKSLAVSRLLSAIQTMGIKKVQPDQPYFSEVDIATYRRKSCMKFPAYRVRELKTGIYPTVETFLAQTPVDTPVMALHDAAPGEETLTTFYYAKENGKTGKKVKDCFAVVTEDGEYECSPKAATRLEMRNNQFIFRRAAPGLRNNVDAATIAIMFGLVGYLTYTTTNPVGAYYQVRLDPVSKTFRPMRRLY